MSVYLSIILHVHYITLHVYYICVLYCVFVFYIYTDNHSTCAAMGDEFLKRSARMGTKRATYRAANPYASVHIYG